MCLLPRTHPVKGCARLSGATSRGHHLGGCRAGDDHLSARVAVSIWGEPVPRLGPMSTHQPGLFDLPDDGRPPSSDRPLPGKRRETWAWTVTAEVTVVDADALRDAAELAEKNAVAVGLSADPTVGDPEAESPADPFDILAWLVWPTDGLEDLLDAGAFLIRGLDTEVTPETDDRCELSWTVTVTLTDVAALRRIAIRAHPDAAALIRDSLAVAWQHAADPYAPLRSIPGISWQPKQVAVHHLPRRARPGADTTL